MNYNETLEYLYASTPVFERVGASAYKEGLSNTLALDEHLSHPHKSFRTIHVAGTNGKGSTSHTLAAVLQSQGFKVGLYTSPHLVDFSERIRVNGKEIDHQYVVDFVKEHRGFFEPLHPSFFELTTAMAFRYFADKKVDVAVIEVGLGGRLDCTNIITPELCVITNISFDHTGFLGDTLAKIAAEKAGIIKQNVPVVIGEYHEETFPVFERVAKEHNAPLTLAENIEVPEELLNNFELKGACQDRNIKTIYATIKTLQGTSLECKANAIENGIAHVCELTGLRGRWETIRESSPKVVCDTGHNLAGWHYLASQIRSMECKTKRIVFGMVDDKDLKGVMQLLPHDAEYYFCKATTHRAVSTEVIASFADTLHLSYRTYQDVPSAYKAALSDADKEDFIFVGGSSYVVSDLLSEEEKVKKEN